MVINHSGSPTGSKWRDATIQFVEESFSNKVRTPKYLQVRRGTSRSEKKESLVASSSTIQLRKDVLIDSIDRLRKGGFKIESPIQLSKKHIEFIVDSWIADELTVKTVQNRMSVLRCAFKVMKKFPLVDICDVVVKKYYESHGTAKFATSRDKSWSGAGLNIAELVRQIRVDNELEADIVEFSAAFGLRFREAIMFKFDIFHVKQDFIIVNVGTKGARPRVVPFDTVEQRALVDRLMSTVNKKTKTFYGPGLSLIQAMNKLRYVMAKYGFTKKELGVTFHGLRHEYANEMFEKLIGEPSPIRGGFMLPSKQLYEAQTIISERLGHSRPIIVTAYTGSASKLQNRQKTALNRIFEVLIKEQDSIAELVNDTAIEKIWIDTKSLGADPYPISLVVDDFGNQEALVKFCDHLKSQHAGGCNISLKTITIGGSDSDLFLLFDRSKTETEKAIA